MTSIDTAATQQTLYDYWRTLLMEEEKNAVRNERLLRKLEDIERRTNLLYHRTERLSQLRRRFAEMLRQQYLNDPEFKCEHYPYEVNVNQYVEPSYVPDPVLFGLDTPPWMPRERDNDILLQRSKDALESLNSYDPFVRPRTQTVYNEAQESPEEKKDVEKDSEGEINNCEVRTLDESDVKKSRKSLSEDQWPVNETNKEVQRSIKPDEHEEEMNYDLQEIDLKVNEIDREIERLEIEVRDREILRRRESEEKERCWRKMEDQLREEQERLGKLRKEREDVRASTISEEEQRREEQEALKREVEEIRRDNETRERVQVEERLKTKVRKGNIEEFELCKAEELRRRGQINIARREYEDRQRKYDEKKMENLEQANQKRGLEEKTTRKNNDSKDCTRKHDDKRQSEHVARLRRQSHENARKLKRRSERNEKQEKPDASDEPSALAAEHSGDDELQSHSPDRNEGPVSDTASLSYVRDENEFYRTTSELDEERLSDLPNRAPEIEQNLQVTKNSSEEEMILREVLKSGQHTPKHNVIEPGPGILKNKQLDTLDVSRNMSNQRRPSFIPRRSSSAMVEREKHLASTVPLIPVNYNSSQKNQQNIAEETTEIKANTMQQEVQRRREMMESEENSERETSGNDERISKLEIQENKSSWQQSWEENTKAMSNLEQCDEDGDMKDSVQYSEQDESRAAAVSSVEIGSIPGDSKNEQQGPGGGIINENELTLGGREPPVAIKARHATIFDSEIVPTVLSPRTIKSRRLAEAGKEMKLNALAKELQTELQREIFQRQISNAKMDPTEFVSHYSCYLPSTSNPNVNVKSFQRDIHTPNLEDLNIQKTSQVLISGIHGAPESGFSDSSPPPRETVKSVSPPKAVQSALDTVPLPEESMRKNSVQVLLEVNQEIAAQEKTPKDKTGRPPKDNSRKESETSSRSDTPSSSVELNCSKDDAKDLRSEYSLLMGKKMEDSPKPTALPLPPPSRRTSVHNHITTGILADGDSRHMPLLAEDQKQNSTKLRNGTPTEQRESWQVSSNGSSPSPYASERMSAQHVRQLITNNVKYHVPNIVAKRVLGLDLFSSDAPRPKDSDPEEDSFFD